jgi:hypothetical protein
MSPQGALFRPFLKFKACRMITAAVISKTVIIDLRYDTKDHIVKFMNHLSFKRF